MQASPPAGPPCRQPGFPETSSFLHPEKTMPLWKIYHPENAFSDEDKQAIAQRITAVYCDRSEEHTSELQSPCNLVCRLLLEKKKSNRHDVGCLTSRRRRNVDDRDCP